MFTENCTNALRLLQIQEKIKVKHSTKEESNLSFKFIDFCLWAT